MHAFSPSGIRAAWLAAGAVLVLTAAPAVPQGTGDPAENWARIAACARQDRASDRQACVDEVFRSTGLLDRAREEAQQRDTFGQQARPAPRAAPPVAAATPAPSRQPTPPTGAPPAELDRIATTVSRAFDPGNKRMVIVTQENQIWQQNESKDLGLPPRPGTSFTIEKGALGSFICRIANGRSFRCRRHD